MNLSIFIILEILIIPLVLTQLDKVSEAGLLQLIERLLSDIPATEASLALSIDSEGDLHVSSNSLRLENDTFSDTIGRIIATIDVPFVIYGEPYGLERLQNNTSLLATSELQFHSLRRRYSAEAVLADLVEQINLSSDRQVSLNQLDYRGL